MHVGSQVLGICVHGGKYIFEELILPQDSYQL